MSEARKNRFEIQGAWFGFFGAFTVTIVGFILGVTRLSLLSNFPGSAAEYHEFFLDLGNESIANWLLVGLPIIYWSAFALGIIGIFISLFRTNIGIRFSGGILLLTALISLGVLIACLGFISNQQTEIINIINTQEGGDPQLLATYGIQVPHLVVWPAIAMGVIWLAGSIFMMGAAPFNEAKYRTRRMKVLARADTAERAGKPQEAIKLYTYAGDISMKLREEDKASEYYAKSREIREVAIQAVLEVEEKRKREELAVRRSKLEEQRREILMRADTAEENEDWARAAIIYKEAASLSVDLGEKKLAAQFTAKSKELAKRAKKARKAKERRSEPASED